MFPYYGNCGFIADYLEQKKDVIEIAYRSVLGNDLLEDVKSSFGLLGKGSFRDSGESTCMYLQSSLKGKCRVKDNGEIDFEDGFTIKIYPSFVFPKDFFENPRVSSAQKHYLIFHEWNHFIGFALNEIPISSVIAFLKKTLKADVKENYREKAEKAREELQEYEECITARLDWEMFPWFFSSGTIRLAEKTKQNLAEWGIDSMPEEEFVYDVLLNWRRHGEKGLSEFTGNIVKSFSGVNVVKKNIAELKSTSS